MCYDKIIIGDNVTISYGVYFACHGRKQGHNEIIIENGAYIGMNASIVARHSIKIGEGAIVGACSLVNKNVEAGAMVAGVPAKPLKDSNIANGGYFQYKHCLVWNGIPSEERELSASAANGMIKSTGAWMLRNIYDWDCSYETNFWFIIRDNYCVDEYGKKTKKYIIKANERFDYRIIEKGVLKEYGYAVYKKAYAHYKINDGFHESEIDFISRIDKMGPEYQIWGAVDKETGKLEAYSICRIIDNVCNYQSSKANPEFLPKYYIMYGLYDARDKYYLTCKNLKYVVSSARSISEHSNIQSFLIEKFKFRRAYCKLKLHYSWWLSIIIKLIYPFRNYIPLVKIKNMCKFEEINRQCS